MQFKGATIRTTCRAIERLYGTAGFARFLAATPPDIRETLATNLRALEWYPVAVVAAVHQAVHDTVGRGSWEASHTVGVQAARLEFSGAYRVLLRAVQYDTIWRRMEVAWAHLASAGRFEWYRQDEGHLRVRIHEVTGFNRGMWFSIAGRAEGLLTLSGSRAADVSILRASRSEAALEAIWIP
jgi:hypothetical protein